MPARWSDPTLGEVVLPITGHSRAVRAFAGGQARIAVHGTAGARMPAGHTTRGCVALDRAPLIR